MKIYTSNGTGVAPLRGVEAIIPNLYRSLVVSIAAKAFDPKY